MSKIILVPDGQAMPELVNEAAPVMWLDKAWNFAAAVAQHVAAGAPQAPPEVVEARLAVCQRGDGLVGNELIEGHCNHYRPSDKACGGAGGCGCYVEWKATWLDQQCPLGRWALDPKSS